MCFINQQTNNCTHVYNLEPTMHAFHRAVLIIKEGIIFSFPSQRNHSSPVKVSASPPAQRHVERTMSWLWEAFKQLWTSEHYFWNELSVKSLPHLKNPQSSQTMRWKVALNEGFSALLRTVSQCHQSDKGLLPSSGFPLTVPPHSKCR